ncbi:MAG: DUF4011 domain-containing protein, partial [Gammaproteobacteria bacterium]|nr:DUF4011 domain-containing protein [Gammaproteobacteria bacterium]
MSVDTHRQDPGPGGGSSPGEDSLSLGAVETNVEDGGSATSDQPQDGPQRRPQGAGEKADTRLSRWQRRLLDLSLHNRLLNFKPTRRSLALFCPEPLTLAEELNAGARVKFVSAPPKPDDGELQPGTAAPPEAAGDRRRRLATEALERNEVMVELESA